MPHDTHLAGAASRFPATRYSVILELRSPDAERRTRAIGTLIAAYWKPVYKYLRLRFRADVEQAEDWTQGFFAEALEKRFLERYEPARARFRTFLRACLDGYVSKQRESASRLKRGGSSTPLSLDFEGAEGELRRLEPRGDVDLEACFHREWVRSLLAMAVDELRRRCAVEAKDVHFALFERYDLEGSDAVERPSYAGLATELGLTVTQVTNHLAWTRRAFRGIVLEQLRELTASEEEFRAEVRHLLGVEPA